MLDRTLKTDGLQNPEWDERLGEIPGLNHVRANQAEGMGDEQQNQQADG